MEAEAESIRRALRARRKQRYSPELKTQIIAYVAARRAAGDSQSTVSAALGVKWSTLRRWLSRTSSTALVPVQVREVAAWTSPTLSLVTPSGYRLDGLDAREAVALFRSL